MLTTAMLLLTLFADAPGLSAKERLYQNACYTGVAMAQSVLPKVATEDELMKRSFASCDGSITRLRKTGELDREPNIPDFACGYAIGATFAKYGLGDEVTRAQPSARALKAQSLCLENLAKQGIGK